MAKETEDPISDMFAVVDEKDRAEAPEAKAPDLTPPEDAPERERNEDGTFKGKEPEKAEKEPKKAEKEEKVEKEEKPKNETVPLAKFLDERNRLKAELDARDLTIRQFNEKLAALEAKLPKAEAPPEPDFVEDPKAYVDDKLAKAISKLEEVNKTATESGKKAEETANAAREQVMLQQFMTSMQSQEQNFVAQNPDYYDALNHIRQIRAYQLEQFEPGITQEKIFEVIRNEEIQMAAHLHRSGKDPVATAYEIAKRYGYVPKKEAPKGNGVGQPPPPAGGKSQLPPDQSLGGGGGAPDTTEDEAVQDAVDQALASLIRRRA